MWYPIYKQLLQEHYDLERKMHMVSPMQKVALCRRYKSVQERLEEFHTRYADEIFHDDFNELFESFDNIICLKAVEAGIFICYKDYMISIINPEFAKSHSQVSGAVIETINSVYPENKELGFISYRKYGYRMLKSSLKKAVKAVKVKPISFCVVCEADEIGLYESERGKVEPYCQFALFAKLSKSVEWVRSTINQRELFTSSLLNK